MKKFTLLLAMLLMAGFSATAQRFPTGNLTVYSEDGTPFYLILNGQRYNDKAQTQVRIEMLPNPYYDCKVIFANNKIPTITKNVSITDEDDLYQDVTYRIKKDRKGKRVLRFYSAIPATQNMMPPSNCAVYHYGEPNDMYIGPDGTQYHQTVTQTTTNDGFGMNVNMPGFGMNVNVPGNGTTTTTTTTTTTNGGGYTQNSNYNNNGNYNNNNGYNNGNNNQNNGGYNNNNGGYNNGNNNGGYNNGNNNQNNNNNTSGCRNAMTTTDFEDACSTIKNTSFDDTRLSTAKLVLERNCVSTNQVITLMKMLSFEANKLELAKYAYGYCVERNNYFKVVNAFSFDASKKELNEYIKGR
ncbi:DUF4476 domain-containing protein [Flavobacterium psychrotrophum]|uniref:DUF4476 domain-containing protein n=1 Tax=Flavobacterium psychrotrophum TaxID=2294119 RepID=UPI0013C52C80|nr:DUF4476 domain-containing protein [Flavobacterium psychrotrophum]